MKFSISDSAVDIARRAASACLAAGLCINAVNLETHTPRLLYLTQTQGVGGSDHRSLHASGHRHILRPVTAPSALQLEPCQACLAREHSAAITSLNQMPGRAMDFPQRRGIESARSFGVLFWIQPPSRAPPPL